MWCKCGWTRKLAFNSTIVVLVGKHYAKAKIGLQFRNSAMHPVRTCLGCYEQATQGDRTPKAETTTWPTDVRLIPKFLLNNDLGITGRNRLQCEAHGGSKPKQENIPFWLFKLRLKLPEILPTVTSRPISRWLDFWLILKYFHVFFIATQASDSLPCNFLFQINLFDLRTWTAG